MQLKGIKFEDHPVLGNLSLDFCVDGKPVRTIIFAGENGTGKTTILEQIFRIGSFENMLTGEEVNVNYLVSLADSEVSQIINLAAQVNAIDNNEIEIAYKSSNPRRWDNIEGIYYDGGVKKSLPNNSFSRKIVFKDFVTLFSNVAINFTPRNIQSVTAANIDDENVQSKETTENIATEITQLLIDIQALDDADLSQWVKANIGMAPTDDDIDKRIWRFNDAFSYIFPSKHYKEIRNVDGQKKVIFNDGDRECAIEDLSSGEKQIVFRGGFFLKDIGSIWNTISIVDEPEISLHPNWQLKIMDFYKKILGINTGYNSSQLFVATHSPFILHNAERSDDKIIILKKEDDGVISVMDEPRFVGWRPKEAIQEAFSVSFEGKFDEPVIFVEGETDEKYLIAALEVLEFDLDGYNVKWIGHNVENGNAQFTGSSALNHTLSFLKANPTIVNSPVILLYDSDTNKPINSLQNLAICRMPFIGTNRRIKKGIENLLDLPDTFNINSFCDEHEKIDDYSAKSINRTLNKNRLCDHLIEKSKDGTYQGVFGNFVPLLEMLKATIQSLKNGER